MIKDQGPGLLVWSPLAGGFLSGKFTRDESPEGTRRATFEFPPVDKEQGFDIVDVMRQLLFWVKQQMLAHQSRLFHRPRLQWGRSKARKVVV